VSAANIYSGEKKKLQDLRAKCSVLFPRIESVRDRVLSFFGIILSLKNLTMSEEYDFK
jgi:hypothetical protein